MAGFYSGKDHPRWNVAKLQTYWAKASQQLFAISYANSDLAVLLWNVELPGYRWRSVASKVFRARRLIWSPSVVETMVILIDLARSDHMQVDPRAWLNFADIPGAPS